MDWQEVECQSIQRIGYDTKRKVLGILFRTNRAFAYHNVPAELHQALLASTLPWSFYVQFIEPDYSRQWMPAWSLKST